MAASVVFESFGSEATPVELTFFVYDEGGDEIYKKVEEVTVLTEEVVYEEFEDVQLESYGKYKLVLRTLYNVGIEDYFEQDFEYVRKQTYWFLLLLIPLLLFGGYFLFKALFSDRKRK